MSRFHVDPNARHPLYPEAMPLSKALPGVEILTLDIHRGNFELTTLASGWRAETMQIVTENGFPLRSVFRLRADDIRGNIVDLCDKGLHPPVEASEQWSDRYFSVEADRDGILTVYPWLVKEGFTRAVNEIEDRFFNFFVDTATFLDQLMRHD